MEEFQTLIDETHKRGMKIMIDIVFSPSRIKTLPMNTPNGSTIVMESQRIGSVIGRILSIYPLRIGSYGIISMKP